MVKAKIKASFSRRDIFNRLIKAKSNEESLDILIKEFTPLRKERKKSVNVQALQHIIDTTPNKNWSHARHLTILACKYNEEGNTPIQFTTIARLQAENKITLNGGK